jgi:hypothetical protein
MIGNNYKIIPQEDGTCVEEMRMAFEPNVVRRRVVPCPKGKGVEAVSAQWTEGVTNEPTVQPTNSNSLNRGSNGKNLKKKRKNRRIAG